MDVYFRIVNLLGGLALFLYGMRIMGDALKSSSGGAMKAALAKATSHPALGFILGLLVTCMIQSSTAAIVITVGLVGAGFLTFRQSIGIVLGANVGTTITAQIIRLMDVDAGSGNVLRFFKSDNLAPTALIIGIILIMFVNTRTSNTVGTILMGFGTLFVGLMNMSSSVAEMGASLSRLLVSFENSPVLGFFSGVLVTGIIQSSSAVVGILQSIASTMGVKFCGVFAVIIGIDIGDCLTTFLVCRIGAKPEQIRTALVHVMYNFIASTLLFVTVGVLRKTGILNDHIWYMTLHAGGVANVHGLFKLVPALLLLPCANLFAKAAERIVPDKPEDPEDTLAKESIRQLDMHLVTNPRLALHESEVVICNMIDVAIHNYNASVDQLFRYDPKRNERVMEREKMLDTMTDVADKYIVAVSPHITLETDDRNQSFQLKALVAVERIGDLAVNIVNHEADMREEGVAFSKSAMAEMRIMMSAVDDILDLTSVSFRTGRLDLAKKIEPLEEVIDEMVEELRARHVYRMTHNMCSVVNGIGFQNILQNLERISDQCSDLGVFMLARSIDDINGKEHKYLSELHESGDEDYTKQFRIFRDKYFAILNTINAASDETKDIATLEEQLRQEFPKELFIGEEAEPAN